MALIDHHTNEIHFKIVYFGPAKVGKTTNMSLIYDSVKPEHKSQWTRYIKEDLTFTEHSVFFDYTPIEFGKLDQYQVRLHLHTVPGVVFYNKNRTIILKDVDGVIFVADSQIERMDSNVELLWMLENNLKHFGYNFETLPYVLQLNKRDLSEILSVGEMKAELLRKDEPVIEAIAYRGIGVLESLNMLRIQLFTHWRQAQQR